MKTLYILLLLAVGFDASAQLSSKLVTTNGRKLRIRVDIEESGRSVHYNRSFDVTGLSESAVQALENRILDSLDRLPSGQTSAKLEEIKTVDNLPDNPNHRFEANAGPAVFPGDGTPASVLFREDKENGRLWMQYIFRKDGDGLVIERTANVIGKTEREKQAIIKETERSFGIKSANQ